MTVSYQSDVASSASGGFLRLLFRWRGSVWKSIYKELMFFAVAYSSLSILYRFVLGEWYQRIFERLVFYCAAFVEFIPLSFMLGFFVTFTATRWWNQYTAIPWPDRMMNIIALYLPGSDDNSRMVRRTLMRYVNLSLVLVLRSISMAVKKRFPTKEHLVEAGFMTKVEMDMYSSVPSTEFNTFWIPCTWFINLLRDARNEGRLTDANGIKLIMEELNDFRTKCGLLWGYDWISIPLVYTQVVTVATYAFFIACMFGRQYVDSPDPIISAKHKYDFYIPVFTILQFIFYMGLLKVAEQLINPFGDDDEDFELNWIIDRHIKVSYLGVDTISGEPPPLVKDNYFDELDIKLPYTEAALEFKRKTYRGSVATMQVPMEQQHLVLPQAIIEDDEEEERENSERGAMGQRRSSVWSMLGGKLNRSFLNFEDLDNWKYNEQATEKQGTKTPPGTWGEKYSDESLATSSSTDQEALVREPMFIGIIPETLFKHPTAPPQPSKSAIKELLGQITPIPMTDQRPRYKHKHRKKWKKRFSEEHPPNSMPTFSSIPYVSPAPDITLTPAFSDSNLLRLDPKRPFLSPFHHLPSASTPILPLLKRRHSEILLCQEPFKSIKSISVPEFQFTPLKPEHAIKAASTGRLPPRPTIPNIRPIPRVDRKVFPNLWRSDFLTPVSEDGSDQVSVPIKSLPSSGGSSPRPSFYSPGKGNGGRNPAFGSSFFSDLKKAEQSTSNIPQERINQLSPDVSIKIEHPAPSSQQRRPSLVSVFPKPQESSPDQSLTHDPESSSDTNVPPPKESSNSQGTPSRSTSFEGSSPETSSRLRTTSTSSGTATPLGSISTPSPQQRSPSTAQQEESTRDSRTDGCSGDRNGWLGANSGQDHRDKK